MKKKFLIVVMAGALFLQNISVLASESDQDRMFSGGINQFALKIYEQMETQENIFFSPYSLGVALSMLNMEAEGETKSQIEKMLGIKDVDEWNRQASEYIKENTREGATVETANAMWISDELELSTNAKEDVLVPLQEFFAGEIFQADIKNENQKILQEINGWVSDHTEGMIDPFLEELPNDMVSMLINAVYFEGEWMNPFDETLTKKEIFYGIEEESEIDMMMQSGTFLRYLETDTYQAIQIPYGDGSVAMNILLPNDMGNQTFEEWYQGLGEDQSEIWEALNEAQETEIEVVKIPKFSMECTIPDLDQILKELGMTEAYSEQADFSRLAEGIQVDNIMHKAKLEVNEKYTKAAGVTGIISKMTAIIEEEEKPEFVADHPFLFVIQDTQNDMILFMGQVNQL